MQKEVDRLSVPLLTTEVVNHGIFAEHNHPCAVCRDKSSVLDLSCGVMQPCWKCQELGYRIVKKRKWFGR